MRKQPLRRAAQLASFVMAYAALQGVVEPDAAWAKHKKGVMAQPPGCYRYEPSVSAVSGVVVATREYGPPNYGETPNVDEKVTVPVLKIDRPIRVCASKNDDGGDDEQVHSMQIVTKNAFPRALYGSRIRVTGTLFSAQSGHHYTSVLIWAKQIAPVSASQLKPAVRRNSSF